MQLLSHFLQSSLYFFLPRSSRKNAHSLLRYFGIRGIMDTSLSLPNCRFAPETQKRPKPAPLYGFGAILGVFFRYERLCFGGGILYRQPFKSRCLSLPGNKKAPYCYDAFVLLGKLYFFLFAYGQLPLGSVSLTAGCSCSSALISAIPSPKYFSTNISM